MGDEITTALGLSQFLKKAILRDRFKDYNHTIETANFNNRVDVASRIGQEIIDIADDLGLKMTITFTEKE